MNEREIVGSATEDFGHVPMVTEWYKMKLSRWGFDFFSGSFDLYQDKRNEHKGILQKEVFENRMLRYDRFKKS